MSQGTEEARADRESAASTEAGLSGTACNIDAKGKALRLGSGTVTTLAGVILLVVAAAGVASTWWVWTLAVAALAGGAFQIYEGWAGWCAVRAMGFRTPI